MRIPDPKATPLGDPTREMHYGATLLRHTDAERWGLDRVPPQGKSNALKELSAARARKDKAGKQKEKNAKRQRIDDGEEVSDDEPSSDEDKDDEDARLSDSDGDAPKRDSRRRTHDLDQADDEQEEEDPVMTIAMLQKVIVSRTTMERWHKQPFFEDTVKGCYTRVLIGLDPKTHEQVCESEGVAP